MVYFRYLPSVPSIFIYCDVYTRCQAITAKQQPLLCSVSRSTMEVLLEVVFSMI
jgi:hypothetical protein